MGKLEILDQYSIWNYPVGNLFSNIGIYNFVLGSLISLDNYIGIYIGIPMGMCIFSSIISPARCKWGKYKEGFGY